jgi:hypothetical protein
MTYLNMTQRNRLKKISFLFVPASVTLCLLVPVLIYSSAAYTGSIFTVARNIAIKTHVDRFSFNITGTMLDTCSSSSNFNASLTSNHSKPVHMSQSTPCRSLLELSTNGRLFKQRFFGNLNTLSLVIGLFTFAKAAYSNVLIYKITL